ncbi:uncharacterized protein LOC129589485 [Paramacrobiotus metropolitanus]|uniref:uncharacterized protein LOC129589485 n=1 Tax=Paramacrobiotus metropolitanus TaxID=2943436 RepID=UPI002445FECF|nr:uncharacterized protein LOC129589485 [Paramacrobiotus metropolitanus]
MAETGDALAVVVEVRGGDGVSQCGKVVAASSSGLIGDFRCTDRRNEWMPLDQASMYWDPVSAYSYSGPMGSRFYSDQGIADPVEVLMQRSSNEPWKWHPGSVLVYDRQHGQFARVAIHLPGKDIRTVVPRNRIRRRAHMISLDYGLLHLMELRGMGGSHAAENHLFYNKSVLRPVAAANASTTPTSGKQQEPADGCLATQKWWKVFLACGGSSASPALMAALPAPVFDAGRAFRVLPLEILTETLYSLPTVDQCRVRAVCVVWNRLLTAAAARNLLHIQFPSKSDCSSSAGRVYIAVACAHRCWSTRTVAVVGSPVQGGFEEKLRLNYLPLCDGRFLLMLIQGAVERFPEDLVIKDINCMYVLEDNAVDYIITLHRVFDKLAAICHTLTVKNFTCEIFDSTEDGWVRITIHMDHIPFGRMHSERCLTVADWWNMNEEGCPRLDKEQELVVSGFIKKRQQHSERFREVLRTIVRARQTNDPRKKVTYLKPAPAAGQHPLGLVDVDRLTRLTQYLVYCAVTHTPFKSTVTWPA